MLSAEMNTPLVDQARTVSSSHSIQPWRSCVAGAAIDLRADRTRVLSMDGPLGWELTVSCGGA